MIRIPKTRWRIKAILLSSLLIGGTIVEATENLPRVERQKLILKTTMYYIAQKHVYPMELNDEFSSKVWDKYFSYLDINHKIFLQEDIRQLRLYKSRLDEDIQANSIEFFEKSNTIYLQRLKELRTICNEILAKPFVFTVNESFRDGNEYAGSLKEQRERWRKSLKLSVLRKFNLIKDKNNGKKDREIEKESRAAVKRWMDAFFDRMTKPEAEDINFSYFMNAILFEVDPHTIYNLPKETKQKQENIAKRYFGIGISMKEDEGEYFVDGVQPGGEANNTGLIHVGDQILQIENEKGEMQDVFSLPAEDVIDMIRGASGTVVRLRIKRNSIQEIVSLKRTELKNESQLARSALFKKGKEKIGIVYLPDFYDDVANPNGAHASLDVMKHIQSLKKQGMTSLIIDLRNNPGGSLNEVVRLAGALTGKGPKAQIRGRAGVQVMQADLEQIYKGPLAVMINERSASASEIFAAAIQDYQRGVIIGGPTSYGKGSAQDVWPIGKMGDESKNIPAVSLGSLTLTSFMFYRATGQTTQKTGVKPDILLPSPSAYVSELEKDYNSALPNVPIPTTNFQLSNSFAKDQIEAWAKQLRYGYTFKQIDSLAKLIAKADKEPIALNFKAYQQQEEKKKERKAYLKTLLKVPQDEQIDVVSESDRSAAGEKWYIDWLENAKNDVYVAEACALLSNWSAENDALQTTYALEVATLRHFFERDNVRDECYLDDINELNVNLNTNADIYRLKKQLTRMKDSVDVMEIINKEGTNITRSIQLSKQDFVRQHPNSYVSLYLLAEEFNAYTAEGYSLAFESLSPALKALNAAESIKKEISRLKVTTTGAEAIDFQRTDQNGNLVKLSNLRGKYVLLDFWGSWCVVCRQAHPHMKELYHQYKDKGFEILAIADESHSKTMQDREKVWKEAIRKDDIPWIHVLAEERNQKINVLQAYGITAFPTKILLDREGKVVMRTIGNLNNEIDEYLRKHL
ncbi:S41 family peptidase [Sphingobacterium sp.]|uniref:S41 family peptidase n=1 Tax=Sphingobacterium sp. TaxID=341027 RepID=UPI0031D0B6B3